MRYTSYILAKNMHKKLMSKIGTGQPHYNLEKDFGIQGELKSVIGVFEVTEKAVIWYDNTKRELRMEYISGE